MLELKEQGNKLFKEGEYLHAAAAYTKAIKKDPANPVLYSNRSAALLRLNKLAKALADAEECVKLDPSWDKGWMRKGMVLESQGQLQEALDCFQKANKAAGGNAEYAAHVRSLKLKTSSQRAQAAKPTAEQAALQYAEGKLEYAKERIQELGSNFPPELHFVHPIKPHGSGHSSQPASSGNEDAGSGSPQQGTKETVIRAPHAFDAPDVLTMFVGEMRQQAETLQATAAVLVAPKSAVSFPQTWQQPSWSCGAHDGVFVQLQALIPRPIDDDTTDQGAPHSSSDGGVGADSNKASGGSSGSSSNKVLRKTWFIRLRPSKPPSEPLEVGEEFALLPPLLR